MGAGEIWFLQQQLLQEGIRIASSLESQLHVAGYVAWISKSGGCLLHG